MKYFIWILAVLMLNACAFHYGDLDANIPNEPVEHRDMAYGVATTVKIFGIGSTNKDALVREAKQKMVINRPLAGDEAYNNITTDVKNTWVGFFKKQKVTMTADVIAPKKNVSDPSYTENYLSKLEYGQSVYDTLFQIGDSVIFKLDHHGEIIGFEGKDGKRIRIKYTKGNGDVVNKAVRGTSVFIPVASYRGAREVREEIGIGPLIAFGVKQDTYQDKDGKYYRFSRAK